MLYIYLVPLSDRRRRDGQYSYTTKILTKEFDAFQEQVERLGMKDADAATQALKLWTELAKDGLLDKEILVCTQALGWRRRLYKMLRCIIHHRTHFSANLPLVTEEQVRADRAASHQQTPESD